MTKRMVPSHLLRKKKRLRIYDKKNGPFLSLDKKKEREIHILSYMHFHFFGIYPYVLKC